MRLLSTSGLLVTALFIGSTAALAETASPVKRQTMEQVVSSLTAQGYTIREIEMDDGNFEAELIDADSVLTEAKIDGLTGEIIQMKRKR